MPIHSFEIRVCDSCGLRYPLTSGHPHGERCPACMGVTHLILTRQLVTEPGPTRPASSCGLLMGDFKKTEARQGTKTVLLDNVRSAWNVGSILRSADGFGFTHAYLCGITSTPENEAVTKTSLGAEESVTWSHHKDAVKLVRGLKKEGWGVYALEDDERARVLSVKEAGDNMNVNAVLIVGSEVTGVDPELLDLCDEIFYIPMRGEKKSFNVAIAFGIAAYAWK